MLATAGVRLAVICKAMAGATVNARKSKKSRTVVLRVFIKPFCIGRQRKKAAARPLLNRPRRWVSAGKLLFCFRRHRNGDVNVGNGTEGGERRSKLALIANHKNCQL